VNAYPLIDPPSEILTSRSAQPESDADLQKTINERSGNAMMASWELACSSDEIYEALAYVGSLSR
jgi:hypothetical protein